MEEFLDGNSNEEDFFFGDDEELERIDRRNVQRKNIFINIFIKKSN